MTASKYPRLSHHDDWQQLPIIISRSCDCAVKHRRSADRVDKILLEYLKLQRSLEQLDRIWSEQDARQLSLSSTIQLRQDDDDDEL
jgi:hypothetical protein